jgi:hypothetical protein
MSKGFSFIIAAFTIAVALLFLSGCMMGPNYKAPSAIMAPSFKETTPASFAENDGWKPGHPNDTILKGDWWTPVP